MSWHNTKYEEERKRRSAEYEQLIEDGYVQDDYDRMQAEKELEETEDDFWDDVLLDMWWDD